MTKTEQTLMYRKERKRGNWIWPLACVMLAGLSLLAAGRSLLIGLDADEQYAVALAYRMAEGDRMIREIWDPHQTSAILPALLIKLYHVFIPDHAFLLLYMRGAGMLLQAAVSFLWYRTLRGEFGSRPAFVTALVLFHTLPKWIVTPEFANQQLLFWLLTILFLYRYEKTGKRRLCLFAGAALCFAVLAYPSCVILFVPYVVRLLKKDRRGALLFTLTCGIGAGIFIGSLFSGLTVSEFMLFMEQILADPTHNAGPGDKLAAYCGEILQLAPYLLIYLALGTALSCLSGRLTRRKDVENTGASGGPGGDRVILAAALTLCVAVADQVRLWAFGLVPAVYPQLHYLLLYVLGGILYHRAAREERNRWGSLYGLAWLPSPAAFAAVLLLTNLDLKASFVHLLPGMLAALLFWCDGSRSQAGKTVHAETGAAASRETTPAFNVRLLAAVMWATVLIGARGYLVRADEGVPENVFCVKQKALYGAAKNVYCVYMTGYEYNSDYLFIEENLEPGTRVLYIGTRLELIYLMNDMEVCAPSVISTPVYDGRYLKYYELNPDKLPEAVIIDREYFRLMEEKNILISPWIREEYDWEGRIESEFLWIMERREEKDRSG